MRRKFIYEFLTHIIKRYGVKNRYATLKYWDEKYQTMTNWNAVPLSIGVTNTEGQRLLFEYKC